MTVNENGRTTSRAWVNTDTFTAYVVNTICVELYQAHAKYTHTHSAVAFQTRRVTKCNYPRTTIIDCCPDFSPVLASSWENMRFLTHKKNSAMDAVCMKSDMPKQAIYFTTKCKMYVTCNGWICYHVQLCAVENRCGVTTLSFPLLVRRIEN